MSAEKDVRSKLSKIDFGELKGYATNMPTNMDNVNTDHAFPLFLRFIPAIAYGDADALTENQKLFFRELKDTVPSLSNAFGGTYKRTTELDSVPFKVSKWRKGRN
eukprot:GHVS01026408.1.p1 GENE.GHVS01026408.1~~GHVS01026408.1.p1  ORF type:complete len:105 (+),score=7.61 GHVS01026408.1:1001-1315(+)